ncbi:MAG TPA: DUF4166 domain-containing protein, partial [Vicinamibacteria bacterium]|nr:DUF4166 domain-containing protein [Vicinamibacteria bacterium]
ELPEPLRLCFEASEERSASGRFRVRWGDGFLARSLARLARLPRSGEAIEVELTVSPDALGETWCRRFGHDRLVTRQWEDHGLLAERVGSLELRFRLVVSERRLLFRQEGGAGLRVAGARIPIPRWLSPRVTACAWEQGRTHVSVEVRCPGVGLLCHYEGSLERREAIR